MEFRMPIEVRAVRDKNEMSLKRAASGGAFSVLARPVIKAGGIVFGAKMFDGGRISHTVAKTLSELEDLQGSVYAQSNMSYIFTQVEEAVRRNILTLFVGTPCQCAAIMSFLTVRNLMDGLEGARNIIFCDLICHGVPSEELFRAHQSWLSRRRKSDNGICSFKFRSKNKGWGLYYDYSFYRKGKMIEVCEPGDYDPYYAAFLRGETYRECCYECPFARRERITDFTIGDYWGIEAAHPSFYDSRGVSLMLINSSKGMHFFSEHAAAECESIKSELSLALNKNHNLNEPTNRPLSRSEILAAIKRYRAIGNMDGLFQKELRTKASFRRFIKRLLPSDVYDKLKRFIKGAK